MRIKTTSDITTSIKGFRGRRMVCRTVQVENEVIHDLESEFGEINVPKWEVDHILDREKKLAHRAYDTRKKLVKTFQQRKKALMIQNLIENRNQKSTRNKSEPRQGRARSSISGINHSISGESGREVVINEIELEY